MTAAAGVFVLGAMWLASATYGQSEDLRERLRHFVAAADARAAALDHRHEAPWGETVDGSAFAHYAAAVAKARALRLLGFEWHVRQDRGTDRNHGAEVTQERLAELRSSWQPVLEELQRGSHARDRRRSPDAGPTGLLVAIAQAEVSARWREGRPHDAVSLWLDLLTFCADVQWSAGGGAPTESLAFWTDTRLQELTGAERQRLAEALQRLEPRLATLPDPRWVVASNVHLRDLLHRASPPAWSLRSRARAWNFGFDPTARELAAMWELAERTAAFDAPAAGGDAERAQWQLLLAAPLCTATANTQHVRSWLEHAEDRQRRDLTELRLLRLALAFAAGDDVPRLADPFADGRIEVAVTGDGTVFRSAGGQARVATRAGRGPTARGGR